MATNKSLLDPSEEFDNLNKDQQKILLDWCRNFDEIKTINSKYSSYGLKEIFTKSRHGFYISNGMFKGAMIKTGFQYKPRESTPQNWEFNISIDSIRRVKELNASE